MSSTTTFADLPYERPDVTQLESAAKASLQAWDEAKDAEQQLAVIKDWDRQRIEYETLKAMVEVRFEQDTRPDANRIEKEFFDDIGPRVAELRLDFLKKALASEHRPQLEDAVGAHGFQLWEKALEGFAPVISEERRAESKLCNRYTELLASLRADLDGESLPLTALAAHYGSPDRGLRLRAQQARFGALDAHRDEFDEIFAELVKVRTQMGKKMGHENFVPLGYAMMRRMDYGPQDVSKFREQVRELIVPLASKIRARHAAQLGVEDYGFHDMTVSDPLGVPRPEGDHDWMIEQAKKMFGELGSDFATFFDTMVSRELMDLKAREGKSGGGFCVDLQAHGVPFIFANFNGTEDDVNVFTHECGHAFQAYSSMKLPLSDYIVPTYESAEIHSMALEFLSFPHMDKFFGADADRYRAGHLEKALLFLPYGVAVDEFQHIVYSETGLSSDERAEAWLDIERRYLPERRYENMPFTESGRFWQVQRHIYQAPFYYIDYCLAQACALQFWHRSLNDREGAMASYRELCNLGGSRAFGDLVRAGGLTLPFDDGCLAGVVESVQAQLG